MEKFLQFLVVSTLAGYLNAEIFSAIDGLAQLAADEKIIIDELRHLSSKVNDEYLTK